MTEERSTASGENRCQAASAAIEPVRSTHTSGRLWLARSLRCLGLAAAILIIPLDLDYHRNSWPRVNDPFQESYHHYAMVIIYIIMQLAFAAIALATGILIDATTASQSSLGNRPDECRQRTSIAQLLFLWCMPTTVGVALLSVNLMGGVGDPWQVQHCWGWPIISSTTNGFLYCATSFVTSGTFSIYWIVVDVLVGAVIVYSIIKSVKYINKRWRTKPQYTLEEIIVFVTAGALTMSFITIERYAHLRGVYYWDVYFWFGEPTYRPVHLLPLGIEIQVLIGVACTIMVIAAAFFQLCGVVVTRIFRIDEDEK